VSEPILDPQYWADRLAKAREGDFHHAVYRCPLDVWRKIEERHRIILALTIKDEDSVLDCGCGWGRLLSLLPPTWSGTYLGVDLSPEFVRMAREQNRAKADRRFLVGDLRNLSLVDDHSYDWAVLISIRPMVVRNLGQDVWDQMEREIRRCARRLLYLEYDMDDNGSIE
jgi:SAM-dependent methyltransferase